MKIKNLFLATLTIMAGLTLTACGSENTQEPTTEEEDEITEDKNRTLEILMAVLSSLLLVAAIVFAIVFTRLKAIKKPKKDNKSNKVSATVDDSQKGFI